MQQYFYQLSDTLFKQLSASEVLLLNFIGEDSDFIRLNNNKIRQAGNVLQCQLELDLIQGTRHAQASVELSGQLDSDLSQLTSMLDKLRQQIGHLPEDPYLHFTTEKHPSEQHHEQPAVDSQQALESIIDTANGLDLVGIFANGIQYAGFANSFGQRNWHSQASFNFDWSCYYQQDKAVKSQYAGFDWQQAVVQNKFNQIKSQLDVLKRPAKTIQPGRYRTYLSPSALSEIISMMSWGGFGLKSHKTRSTPLIQMVQDQRHLNPCINLQEKHSRALAPAFTQQGFIKPEQVQLIENGKYKDCLVNSRSAKEYNTTLNADSEYPGSIDMSPGKLDAAQVLAELDTGLYINNLWYLNFSERNTCQLTGMTRFACFWVENGEIKSPLNVMRFDDSVYHLLGDKLIDLSQQREFIFDSSSYGHRSNHSIELPGALLEDMCFTL